MATYNKYEIVEPDDPKRCQAVHGRGQCKYKAQEGSDKCPMHAGNWGEAAARKETLRRYQLAKWQASTEGFADDPEIKSIRDEIAITRMMLEQTVAKCRDSGELLLMSGKISDLIMKIEKLVSSCHRMETSMGQMLDKSKVIALAAQLVEIISQHVEDDDAISQISNDIVNAILNAQGVTKSE